MFKVLKIDGPNVMTDKGGICLSPFQYADGGETKPVNGTDWRMMRHLFVASPAMLSALASAEEVLCRLWQGVEVDRDKLIAVHQEVCQAMQQTKVHGRAE